MVIMMVFIRQNNDNIGKLDKFMEIDEKDQQLIALLRENARMSTSDIARKMGMSRTTIQDRIQRLETRGIVAGYTVKLAEELSSRLVRAHVMLMLEPKAQNAVIAYIRKMDIARAVYTISGEYDLIVVLGAPNTASLDAALDELTDINGVVRTKSSVVLTTKFER